MMSRISHADIASLDSSGTFDGQWYAQEYPDVAASGLEPAEHFLWIGARLGRRRMPPASVVRDCVTAPPAPVAITPEPDSNYDALFIDGTNGTSSTPYRVLRIAHGLQYEGLKVRCIKGEDLFGLMGQDLSAKLVIVHRAPYWPPFIEFVAKMRAKGATIVFDVDDLIFDEAVVPYIDGFKYLSDEGKEGFLNGLRAYREFILNADMCTTPTEFLADEMRKLGKPAFRVRNAISQDNIEFFQTADYKRKVRPSPFVVGYYSGTRTHQADFAVAAPALIQFMHETPDVIFRLIGDFDLHDWPQLVNWQHVHRAGDLPRLTRVGLMQHDAMIRDQLSCDLIIAPLEVGNPFCEAKSELKFFEASLAQCPVIASATRTFVSASDNGRLADLAVTTEDWLMSFRSIYANYPVALLRARHAFQYVTTTYSQRFAANEALEAYEHFVGTHFGDPLWQDTLGADSGKTADIGVVLPDFSGPSGGHRKIFAVCEALEKKGYSLKLYFYTGRPPKAIKRDIFRFFCNLRAEVAIFSAVVDAHSYFICTQWKTAYDFRWVDFSGKVFFFVQDFEPMFHPVGSNYMRALASYRVGFEIICYGDWVAAKLKDEVGVDAKTISFTLDHDVYGRPQFERDREIDVLLFARPSQDRRCFDLIVEGLVKLSQARPDIQIGLFGEDDYEDIGFAFVNYGTYSDPAELAKLYRRAKVGICYSPTNPSQLGYEMVASGVCLVDVRIKFSELNFGGEEFVRYCDGTPEDMCEACLDLLAGPADRARRQLAGYRFVDAMPGDDALGSAFLAAAGLD